jgi:hypothetical protein
MEKATKTLGNITASLDDVQDVISELSSSNESIATAAASCSDIEAAKLQLNAAFCIASVYYILQNTNGRLAPARLKGIEKQTQRIKQQFLKNREVEKELKAFHERGDREASRTLVIDQGAAQRLIINSLEFGAQNNKKPRIS